MYNTIFGRSEGEAEPWMVWLQGVFDGEEVSPAYPVPAHGGVQGLGGPPAVREYKSLAALCKQVEVHPTQISHWEQQLKEGAADVFGGGSHPEPVDLVPLQAKIGQLALESYFWEGALTRAGLLSEKR